MADAGEDAEAGRGRRAGARRAGRNRGALERLRAARAGTAGARAEAFEFRREEAVYETVDEAEYARIVEVRPRRPPVLLPRPRPPPAPGG